MRLKLAQTFFREDIPMFERLIEKTRKRRAYLRTKAEIARMPRDIAQDLDINPRDAARIAAKAVYG